MKSRRRTKRGEQACFRDKCHPPGGCVLVLLIIFMVTAPMLQMGIDINLPQVKAKTIDVSEEKIVLTVNGNKDIFINNYKTTLPELGVKLESIFKSRIEREVYMRADKRRALWLCRPGHGGSQEGRGRQARDDYRTSQGAAEHAVRFWQTEPAKLRHEQDVVISLLVHTLFISALLFSSHCLLKRSLSARFMTSTL